MRHRSLETLRDQEQRARQLRRAGQWIPLAQLLDSLPPAELAAAPELRILRAEAALRLGDAHQAVELTNTITADNEPPSSLRAKALLIRSAASRLRGFPDKALEDAWTALAIVEADSCSAELAMESHEQVGIALGMTGELDQSIEHLERALGMCAKSSDLGLLAGIQQSLGVALAYVGQLSEAQVHFTNARAAYRKLGRAPELSVVLDNIGRLHHDLGEHDLALKTLQEALQLARDSQAHRSEAMILINMGDTLREMGRNEEALDTYQSALQPSEQALVPRLFCCANTGIGSAHLALRDFEKARFFLRQAGYEAERLKLRHELAVATLQQGVLACAEQDYPQASEGLEKSVKLLEEIGSAGPLVKAYLYLSLSLFRTRKWARLDRSLQRLATAVRELDLRPQLVREAKAVPEVVDYAASKRIGDKLFRTVKDELEGRRGQPSGATRVDTGDAQPAAAHPRIEVRSLGELEVLADGRRVSDAEWESQKAKELFLYLLCHRSGKRREELLEVLWPEVSVGLSRNAFYNNVYRTRRALYRECIVLEGGAYKVNPKGEFCFDLEEFRRLVAEAERQPGGSEKRASLLTQAIKLYRGSFLGEFYAEWADTIRLEAEAQYSRSLARLAGFHAARGSCEDAIRLLEELLALDRTDEAAHEQLIKLLIKRGDLQDAQRRYNLYRELMIRELKAQPSKGFAELRIEALAAR